jgi:hypothetical protein
MFQKRKGEIALSTIFAQLFATLFIAGGLLRTSHIERRAKEKCEAEGTSQAVCEALYSTKEEQLAFIKDDEVTGNGGNYTDGTMK